MKADLVDLSRKLLATNFMQVCERSCMQLLVMIWPRKEFCGKKITFII